MHPGIKPVSNFKGGHRQHGHASKVTYLLHTANACQSSGCWTLCHKTKYFLQINKLYTVLTNEQVVYCHCYLLFRFKVGHWSGNGFWWNLNNQRSNLYKTFRMTTYCLQNTTLQNQYQTKHTHLCSSKTMEYSYYKESYWQLYVYGYIQKRQWNPTSGEHY